MPALPNPFPPADGPAPSVDELTRVLSSARKIEVHVGGRAIDGPMRPEASPLLLGVPRERLCEALAFTAPESPERQPEMGEVTLVIEGTDGTRATIGLMASGWARVFLWRTDVRLTRPDAVFELLADAGLAQASAWAQAARASRATGDAAARDLDAWLDAAPSDLALYARATAVPGAVDAGAVVAAVERGSVAAPDAFATRALAWSARLPPAAPRTSRTFVDLVLATIGLLALDRAASHPDAPEDARRGFAGYLERIELAGTTTDGALEIVYRSAQAGRIVAVAAHERDLFVLDWPYLVRLPGTGERSPIRVGFADALFTDAASSRVVFARGTAHFDAHTGASVAVATPDSFDAARASFADAGEVVGVADGAGGAVAVVVGPETSRIVLVRARSVAERAVGTFVSRHRYFSCAVGTTRAFVAAGSVVLATSLAEAS